jgi:hypothetical protein
VDLRFALVAVLGAWSVPAWAARPALDPLNRGHVGVSFSDGNTIGLNGGLDSRLTRIVFIDVGAFGSPITFPEMDVRTGQDPGEYVFLRHGIYVAPGLRLPHRDTDGLDWDLIGRGGFGGVWSTDVNPTNYLATGSGRYEVEADPAALAGLDVQLRKERVGLRAGAKAYLFKIFSQELVEDVVLVKPQWSGEVVYQW